MGKRKRTSDSSELTIAVIVTVRCDPDKENVGAITVALDVGGSEAVVGIIKTAYRMGALDSGIDAFTASVVRTLGPQAPTLSASGGRA